MASRDYALLVKQGKRVVAIERVGVLSAEARTSEIDAEALFSLARNLNALARAKMLGTKNRKAA